MKNALGFFLLAALCTSCAVPHTVTSAGNIASGAVRTAGNTAAGATRTASRTAFGAIGTAGSIVHSTGLAAFSVVKAAADVVVDVAKAPFVIFKDRKTGRCHEVAWAEGMTLDLAIAKSNLKTDRTSTKVIRGNATMSGGDVVLQPNDVIEVDSGNAAVELSGVGTL